MKHIVICVVTGMLGFVAGGRAETAQPNDEYKGDFTGNPDSTAYMDITHNNPLNVPTAGVDYHVPFGGRKNSNFGPREQGSYAREFYTIVKTCYTLA